MAITSAVERNDITEGFGILYFFFDGTGDGPYNTVIISYIRTMISEHLRPGCWPMTLQTIAFFPGLHSKSRVAVPARPCPPFLTGAQLFALPFPNTPPGAGGRASPPVLFSLLTTCAEEGKAGYAACLSPPYCSSPAALCTPHFP